MGLIEKWQIKANAARKIQPIVTGTIKHCIAELTDATTPRPPKSEWFGTGPGQWDSWWFAEFGICRRCVLNGEWLHAHWGAGFDGTMGAEYFPVKLRHGLSCIPVRREGPPAMDVGWEAVGG